MKRGGLSRFGMARMVASGAARGEGVTQGVGVVGPVGHQHVAAIDRAEHVLGATSVMGLAFGELEHDRQPAGVHHSVDFGRQPAARATHATGSRFFFWPLAACWCTRIEEELIIWISPS